MSRSALAALAGGPVQIAYGVTDIAQAAQTWTATLGAGPFFLRHHIPVDGVWVDDVLVDDVLVGGAPGVFDHSSAYGQWGSIMVELVAVHAPATLAATGIHHLAYFVHSFDEAAEELTANGWPVALTAMAGSTRFGFFDARGDLGHLIEIYEPSPGLLGFYAMVADAAQDWDGSDPIRTL